MRYKPLITAELHKGFSRDQGFIHLCERVKSWFKPSAFLNSWNSLFFFFLPSNPQKLQSKQFDGQLSLISVPGSFLLKIVFDRNNLFPSCQRTSELELRKIQPWLLLIASYFRKVCMFRESLAKARVVTKGTAIVSDKLPLHWHFRVIPRSGSIRMATGWYLWRYQKLKKTVAQRRSARSLFPWIPSRILSPAAQPAKVHLLKMRLRLKGTWTDFPVAWDLLPGCKCQ